MRGATHERQTFGVVALDGVLVVVGDDCHQRVLRVRATSKLDVELPQHELRAARVGIGLHRLEQRDCFADLALTRDSFAANRVASARTARSASAPAAVLVASA